MLKAIPAMHTQWKQLSQERNIVRMLQNIVSFAEGVEKQHGSVNHSPTRLSEGTAILTIRQLRILYCWASSVMTSCITSRSSTNASILARSPASDPDHPRTVPGLTSSHDTSLPRSRKCSFSLSRNCVTILTVPPSSDTSSSIAPHCFIRASRLCTIARTSVPATSLSTQRSSDSRRMIINLACVTRKTRSIYFHGAS